MNRIKYIQVFISHIILIALSLGGAFYYLHTHTSVQLLDSTKQLLENANTATYKSLKLKINHFHQISQVLVKDFAFKRAFSTGDETTILSAMNNHKKRIEADFMVIIDNENTLYSTVPELNKFKDQLIQLKDTSALKEIFYQPVAFDGDLYQITMVEMKAPITIATILVGFQYTDDLLRDISPSEDISISVIESDNEQYEIWNSTLDEDEQNDLIRQLNRVSSKKTFETMNKKYSTSGENIHFLINSSMSYEKVIAPINGFKFFLKLIFVGGILISLPLSARLSNVISE